MAREYGRLSTGFWRNPKVRGVLSDDEKLLLTYIFSCEHSTAAGCYRLPLAYISDDLQWGIDRVSHALSELHRHGFVCRDDTHDIIYVPGWWDENEIASSKNAIHVYNLFKLLPDCWIRTAAIENLKAYPNHKATVSEELAKGLPVCTAPACQPDAPSEPHRMSVRSPEPEPEPEPEPVVRRSEENSVFEEKLVGPAPTKPSAETINMGNPITDQATPASDGRPKSAYAPLPVVPRPVPSAIPTPPASAAPTPMPKRNLATGSTDDFPDLPPELAEAQRKAREQRTKPVEAA